MVIEIDSTVAVFVAAQAVGLLWWIARLDRRIAVMRNDLRMIRRELDLVTGHTDAADL